ncbi:proline-rich protein 2-like [Haemorhous mexicanus]|uniref:proline-rich protein 2-like n=1 Tax=Haemorhous mexicanus TaxID=30427 RepID=UPI0028BE50D1|nr:proline-rich protein 2-like [Haemorhous mexicanus]
MRYRRKGARTELSRGLAPAPSRDRPERSGCRDPAGRVLRPSVRPPARPRLSPRARSGACRPQPASAGRARHRPCHTPDPGGAGLRSRVPGVRCRALPWPRGPPGHRLLHRETFTAASRGRTDSPAPLRPRQPPGAGGDPPRPAGAVPRSREGPPRRTGPSAEPQPPRGPGHTSSAPLGPAAVPAPAEAQPGQPGGRKVLVLVPPPPARPQNPPPRTGCSRRGGRGSRCCCCRCRRGSAAAVAYGSLPAGMPARRWHNPRRGRAGRGQLLARRRCRGAGTAEAGGGEAGGPPQLRGRRERGRRRAPRRHCPCPAVARWPRGFIRPPNEPSPAHRQHREPPLPSPRRSARPQPSGRGEGVAWRPL